MYNLSIKDRLNEILFMCDMTRKEFCKHINIDERIFMRYIDKESFYMNHFEKIYYLGINLNWLITGNEERFNETYNGQKLKVQLNKRDYQPNDYNNYILFKLDKWISLFYGSIREFEITEGIQDFQYFKVIEKSEQLPMKLLKELSLKGLNIKWLYNVESNPFSNSNEGRRKKRVTLKLKDEECFIYREIRKEK